MTVEIEEDDYLAHYGILRKSGRYPWGSGEDPAQRGGTFINTLKKLRDQGLSEVEVAEMFDMTTKQLRETNTIARNETKAANIAQAQRLAAKGMSKAAIGERMGGLNESSVRALLAEGEKRKEDILKATSDMLREQVNSKGYIDIGSGVENQLGISKEKLGTAVALLKDEGYEQITVQIDQLGTGPGNKTLVKVLAPPGTTYGDVKRNKDKISQITTHSEDGGEGYLGIKPHLSIDPARVAVKYAEQGGTQADGVIYVRPGVDDITLGGGNYAQVRIAVGDKHYLKGMAMYKDDLPDGVDLMFNTNKSNTGSKLDAMKKMQTDKDGNIDKDNPFGASIRRQITTPDGKTVTSVMNLVNEEGDWDQWSRNLSSQFLSKQSPTLARTQLDMSYERKKNELEEIRSLTNPAVRKKLLDAYADDVDASAIHLKAASLPRQATHVILPVNSLKETEVYAPKFLNGERVVLVRFPHGGTFEIPELVVNNKNPEARKSLGNARDAVGINAKVAERLSGADFDGDTVLVIPNNHGAIKTSPALEKLKGFDPKGSYPAYDGMRTMGGGIWNAKEKKEELPEGRSEAKAKAASARTKGIQMGLVSNLITDMTIQRASNDELARAVRHSMVVIDAEKHVLNYKQSAIDNGIAQLMLKYQGRKTGGAATLISRKKSSVEVPERKATYRVDRETGKKVFTETGASYQRDDGKVDFKVSKVNRLGDTDNAHTLSSGTLIEKVYADHSNRLKALANEARKSSVNTKTIPYSSSARTAYASEVNRLQSALNVALQNAPRERAAQLLANAIVDQKKADYPGMESSELKKIKGQALNAARERTGASKARIEISPSEWKAIQAGALFNNTLNKILDNADLDKVKQLATPRERTVMSSIMMSRARQMLASGFTQAEVASQLGVSTSTLNDALK